MAASSDTSLFDSHCHLDFEVFDEDRSAVLQRAEQAGVSQVMVPGVAAEQWPRLLELARHYPQWSIGLGLHPYFIAEHQQEHLRQLEQLLRQQANNGQLRALGEIGLDATCDQFDWQLELLQQQLAMAKQHQLPVILHHRKTLDTLLKNVRDYAVNAGVVHAFSGSYEQAKSWVDAGFYLGVGGTITYSRASKTRDAIKRMPLDALLLETDSPDMPMAGYQGQRNEPARILEVVSHLAQLHNCSEQAIARQCSTNTKRLFRL